MLLVASKAARGRRAEHENHIGFRTHPIYGERPQLAVRSCGAPPVDDDRLALDVAKLAQPNVHRGYNSQALSVPATIWVYRNMGLPQRDQARYTYADYLSWPDEPRYELVDGIAYAMAPAPARVHQEIAGEIYRQAANALVGKPSRAFIASLDVRLPKADETDEKTDTVVQPDLLVVCDERKLDERGVRGAPDWIVEILSPATASHDQIVKLAAYERAKVPEYWLVHPSDRIVTVYRLEGGAYGRPAIHELTGTLAVGNVPGIVIDWAQLPLSPA